MKHLQIIIFLIISAFSAMAQAPQVNNLESKNTYPGDTITISGSQFSANLADLSVWFGAVEGNIIRSTASTIDVRVPEEASFERIYVTNHVTGLTGFSQSKFYTSYSGEATFNETEFSAPLVFNAAGAEGEFYDLCACDFDGDGKPEIAATKFADALDLVVLKNNSTPENISFNLLSSAQVPNLNVGSPTLNIFCGDLNGDGKSDLITSRYGVTRNNVFVLQNTSTTGTISFAPKITLLMAAEVKSRRIKLADLNFDGKPEVIVTDVGSNNLQVFINTSTTTTISFQATPLIIPVAGADNTSGIEIQDLNADKKPDIIITQFFKDNVFILPNTSSSSQISFGTTVTLAKVGTPLLNVKTGDVDFDGLADIIVTNTSSNQIFIFPNLSSSSISFGAPVSVPTGTGPWGIDLADMNGDSKLDLLIGNQNLQQVNVLINNSTPGAFSFTRSNITTDANIRNLVANDFDGDGKPDVAFGSFIPNTGPYKIQIIRNLNCYIPRFMNDTDPVPICPGQTPTLRAVPNSIATYNWYKDGSTTPVKSGAESYLTVSTSGSYRVEAITEGGACTISNTIQVNDATGTVPSDPTPVSNSPVCEGETLNLSVEAVTNAIYSWTGPDNFISDLREPVINNVTSANAGIYTVVIRVGDCRSNPASITVEVSSLPVFTVSAQHAGGFCEGTANQLTVTALSGYSYEWHKDGTPVAGATGTSYNATTSGSYAVKVTDNNTGCSKMTEAVVLNAFTAPTAAFTVSSSSVCTGEEVIITNTSTVDPDATPVYTWDLGNGTTVTGDAPTITYTTAGNVTVQLDVSYTGVTGCTARSQQTVTVTAATVPQITSSLTESCPDEPVELSVAGTFTSITWSTGETSSSITVDQPGTYSVATVDNNGCSAENTIVINAKAVPDVQASADNTTINPGQQVQLNATGADTYSWAPEAMVSDPLIANPTATPTQTTKFYVTGTLTGGCSAIDSITVVVSSGGELAINPKKVFSPDSDINPTWVLDDNIASYSSCTLTIYDERGVKVHERQSYNNDWDATYEGNPLPEGVYYYVFGCPDGGKKMGTVLVVRK